MFSMLLKVKCIWFVFFVINNSRATNTDVNKTILLEKIITFSNKELYGEFIYLNSSSTLTIDINIVDKNLSFIIFQVHSHIHNVTLYQNTNNPELNHSGINVGIYNEVTSVAPFHILNPNNMDLKLYLSIHGYWKEDPIPGGCNMVYPDPITPYIIPTPFKGYVNVDVAPADDPSDPQCLNADVNITFYMVYLPEQNFDEDIYFEKLRNMLTYENIVNNGKIVPKTIWKVRRMMSAYPGTGAVYAVIADKFSSNSYSIYVSAATYGCNLSTDGRCELLEDTFSALVCALLLFLGLFICYLGHRFFMTEMFVTGLLTGVVLTYILLALIYDFNEAPLIAVSVVSGVLFGAIWWIFWWFYGWPIAALLLPFLNVGFLISSIVYYLLPNDIEILQLNKNFIPLFILFMFLSVLLLVTVAEYANLLCCAWIGAYAALFPIDFYLGSNLKYIVINTVRRVVIPNFGRAVLMPPFQWKDGVMTAFWVILTVSGLATQYWHNRRRPPFPPPPRDALREPPPPHRTRTAYGTSEVSTLQPNNPGASHERTRLLA